MNGSTLLLYLFLSITATTTLIIRCLTITNTNTTSSSVILMLVYLYTPITLLVVSLAAVLCLVTQRSYDTKNGCEGDYPFGTFISLFRISTEYPIAGFHCHAIKIKIKNHPMNEVKKLTRYRRQEPMKRSFHLPYKPYESTFSRIFLFLERRGVLAFARTVSNAQSE